MGEIIYKEFTWKTFALKEMYSAYVGKKEEDVEDVFMGESAIYNRLRVLELVEAFTEEVVTITIEGVESYVRKSEVEKLNLITSM